MSRPYANFWSHAAAELTAVAHTRASLLRWIIWIALIGVWLGFGISFWIRHYSFFEAAYRTFAAFSMYDDYFAHTEEGNLVFELQVVRFAALLVPLIGLVFAFSGQLGSSLARIFNLGATRHVVIAGDSAPALSLARDCCDKHHDAVILIAQNLPDETALNLRRQGVVVLEGDATNPDTLRTARAHFASHVVAFEPDDASNLQVEAAVRRLVGNARRRPPIGVHVYTRSPLLLREAREMRSAQMQRHDKRTHLSIDPKPFSLEEVAARDLVQQQSQAMLSLAAQLKQDRVHVVFFGFDDAAEAVAAGVFKSLWSAHFEAPRVTVLSPAPDAAEARFRARHREAFLHPDLWIADIAFLPFDWDAASVGHELLDRVEAERGKPTAAVVATGSDPGNIHLAIALKRACNNRTRWPIPIYMKETSESEFSKEYAHGDDTPELDAYLQAFGAHQKTATRSKILDGALDRGAAIAHEHYSRNLADKEQMSMRELQAAMKDWSDVLETYRAANRAVADSAVVKIWDAGWRPANKTEKGETAPAIPPDMLEPMAKREHDRWVAERLMVGWRPTGSGEIRDNELMAHDKLVAWEALSPEDRDKDATQVRAAIDIARLMSPQGFVARS